MAGYKETPRQKMIGMMYLVLTALLALNVSKDIINAFITVNESMEVTNQNFDKKLNETYSKFEAQAAIAGPTAEEWIGKAFQARSLSDSLVSFLENMKNELIVFSDRNIETLEQADTTDLRLIRARDNFDDPTRFFLGTEMSAKEGKAQELIDRFGAYRQKMISLVKPEDQDKLQLGLVTEGKFRDEYGKEHDWSKHHFYHTILAADIVILNKFIAEVRNAEFDVVTRLFSYIGATDFKFNKIAAKVVPSRTILFKGETYEAELLVAAYDTSVTPNVRYAMGMEKWPEGYTGGTSLTGEKGVSVLKIPAGDIGLKRYAGAITIKDPFGMDVSYPFSGEFAVQEPLAVVSADKMSVLYIGLDNPISVSVPGITPDNIDIRITGPAEYRKVSSGKYIVKPSNEGRVTVQVLAMVDKQQKVMGEREYRLLPVPPPTISVAGKTAGQSIALDDLRRARVEAVLRDFLFDDVRFVVTRFELSATVAGLSQSVSVNGNAMTDEAMRLIQKLGTKQIVIIGNISVKGPDGKERPLSTAVNLKTM